MGDVVSLSPTIFVRSDTIFGRRTYVEVQPRRVDHPTEFFNNPDLARRFAADKAKATGWPVVDEVVEYRSGGAV